MKTWQQHVAEFAKTANKAQNELNPTTWPLIPESAVPITGQAYEFICQMVDDEVEELLEAITDADQADAYLDIIYYILDTTAKHGISLNLDTESFTEQPPKFIPVSKDFKEQINTLMILVKDGNTDTQAAHLEDVCHICLDEADTRGVDLQPLFTAVHEANMAKFPNGVVTLDTDESSKRYGKVEKPEGWAAPDIESVLNKQRPKLEIDFQGQDPDEWLKQQQQAAHE